jgi:MFS family permease
VSAAQAKAEFDADWAAIVVVIFGATAFSLSQGVTYPLISLILTARGVSPSVIGLTGACFAIGLAAAMLLVGPLTRVLRGHRLIVAALLGASVTLSIFASFDQLWIWFIARFIHGCCSSIIFMMSEAWLNTACPDRIRGRISGLYGMGICGGFAAGPMAIPLFGTEDGFAFALLAVYIAFVAFATVIICRRAQTEPESTTSSMFLRFVLKAPMLVAMVAAFGFADIAAISGMPVYFTRLGYSESFAAISITMLALPTALSQPAVGWMLDTFSRGTVALVAAAVTAVCFMILPMLTSEVAIIVDFAIVGTASVGLYTAALTLLGERYNGSMLVAGSAAFALAYAFGSGIGSFSFGMAMQAFSPAAGPIMVGAVMFVFAAAFAIGRLKRSS